MRPTFAAAFVLAAFVVFSVRAQQPRAAVDVSSLGPQVGKRVPDFALPDQNCKIWTLDSITGEKGAMILFHRSANW